ncbi:unnamed protein product [Camellia sinensis]
MDVIKAQQISARPIEKVIVHPLVLLSIVDNYNQVASSVSSSEALSKAPSISPTATLVPFEEDDKDPSMWFLDHNYHESMFSMFKRINGYVPNPVLVIIDVQPKDLGIPTKAYYAVEEVKENATLKSQKVFAHVPSEIAAHEVEEIGDVFNLLPNLNVAELIEAFAVKTNDMMLVIYLSSLIRSVVALHDLINSKPETIDCSNGWLKGLTKVYIPFLASGDVSGYDLDRSYPLPRLAEETYQSLDPIQPPIGPPYTSS